MRQSGTKLGRRTLVACASYLFRIANLLPWALSIRGGHGRENRVLRPRKTVRPLVANTVAIDGSSNRVDLSDVRRLSRSQITIKGSHNEVTIGNASVNGLVVVLTGDHNRVIIEEGCVVIQSAGAVCEGSGNLIQVGADTQMHGSVEMAALEGTAIVIGRDCLFSGGVHIRTGDSHSVVDTSGRRINPASSITLADRVWMGRNTTLLKGSAVGADSIVAAEAVVTKRFTEPNCVLAGNPATIVKTGISWKHELMPIEPGLGDSQLPYEG